MKPKGLVAAASITSQMSMPMRMPSIFSSFTSAIFTQRKMFSSSLVISAACVELTGTTLATICAYSDAAARPEGGFTPPTTFGICARPYCLLPGSSRSGENARKKSVPICSLSGPCATGHFMPRFFQHRQHQFLGRAGIGGRFQHHQLPALQVWANRLGGVLHIGQVGLAPLIERRRHADEDRRPFRPAARNRWWRRNAWTARTAEFCFAECAGCRSGPRFSFSTFAGSVSNPVTRCPASANRKPSGSPTYPQPIIPTRSCAPLKNSGLRSVGIDVFLRSC